MSGAKYFILFIFSILCIGVDYAAKSSTSLQAAYVLANDEKNGPHSISIYVCAVGTSSNPADLSPCALATTQKFSAVGYFPKGSPNSPLHDSISINSYNGQEYAYVSQIGDISYQCPINFDGTFGSCAPIAQDTTMLTANITQVVFPPTGSGQGGAYLSFPPINVIYYCANYNPTNSGTASPTVFSNCRNIYNDTEYATGAFTTTLVNNSAYTYILNPNGDTPEIDICSNPVPVPLYNTSCISDGTAFSGPLGYPVDMVATGGSNPYAFLTFCLNTTSTPGYPCDEVQARSSLLLYGTPFVTPADNHGNLPAALVNPVTLPHFQSLSSAIMWPPDSLAINTVNGKTYLYYAVASSFHTPQIYFCAIPNPPALPPTSPKDNNAVCSPTTLSNLPSNLQTDGLVFAMLPSP